MPFDIVSQLLVHKILAIYRPIKLDQISGNPVVKKKNDIKYNLLTLDQPFKRCRIFDIDSDKLKDYKERGEYEIGMCDLLSKFPMQPGDIVLVEDEVRINSYYIKENEFLSLEPFVKLFKTYSYVVKQYEGELILTDDTIIRIPNDFFGLDTELT